MKYLMWLLWLFIPRQDGEGDGDGDGGTGDDGDGGAGDSDSGGSGDSAAGDPAKPIGGSDPEGRPDWLPEKFWNEDLKAPRAEVMAKSFTELENKLRSKTDDLKAEILEEMRASAPEG
jgi:hypothetical protein